MRAPDSDSDSWPAIVGLLAAFFLGLFVLELAAIALLDWLDGRPSGVLAALDGFLDSLDGGL